MTITVTQTQKLVAETALSAVGANDMLRDPDTIDTLVRAMLVIESGHMQAYMLRGFNWSNRSRNRRDPLGTFLDRHNLEQSVEIFHGTIDGARGEAARRIRGNRARRQREEQRMIAEYEQQREARQEARQKLHRVQREIELAAEKIAEMIA